MDFEQPMRVRRGQARRAARKIAREIVEHRELKIIKKYIDQTAIDSDEAIQALLLCAELLCPPAGDKALEEYRRQRIEMIAAPIEECLSRTDFIIPMGALNFLCGAYRRELKAICAAAEELIAEERHGDLCCLIANEYIERRKHCLGSKLIAVHLVIDGDNVSLYDGNRREITDKYSAYLPDEDRRRYTRSDLVLSAMVDIAPRSIYVYGGSTNLKLLRRIQLMFTNVFPVCEKQSMF